MTSSFINDIYLTNSIVGFIYAGYQGAFAAQNILSQLGYKSFNPDDLSRVEHVLSEAEKWKEDLLRGLPIFSTTWKSPQTVSAKKAFEKLADLRKDLLQTVGKIKKILLLQDLPNCPEEVKLLIACFSRQAYARENYVSGFIEFGNAFKHQDIVNAYTPFLTEAQQAVQAAHMFYNIYTSEENLAPVFYKGLSEECSFLPGIFQAQVHDVTLLASSYNMPLSYTQLGINPDHQSEWEQIGINPVVAGYWQAWELEPAIAASWIEVGIGDPKTVWFWKNMGFAPKEAVDWFRYGFLPPNARAWRERGFAPEQAVRTIQDEILKQKSIAKFENPQQAESQGQESGQIENAESSNPANSEEKKGEQE